MDNFLSHFCHKTPEFCIFEQNVGSRCPCCRMYGTVLQDCCILWPLYYIFCSIESQKQRLKKPSMPSSPVLGSKTHEIAMSMLCFIVLSGMPISVVLHALTPQTPGLFRHHFGTETLKSRKHRRIWNAKIASPRKEWRITPLELLEREYRKTWKHRRIWDAKMTLAQKPSKMHGTPPQNASKYWRNSLFF